MDFITFEFVRDRRLWAATSPASLCMCVLSTPTRSSRGALRAKPWPTRDR